MRTFTGTGRVDTPAFTRPAALTIMAWVRSPGTAAEAVLWSHSSSSGTRLSFLTNGDLQYRRSFSTTDGVWTVPAANINAVVSSRAAWFGIAVRHDGSATANDATVYVCTESTAWTAVTATRTTGPVGSVSTSSSGNPRWGNNWNASLPFVGDLGPVAYHTAVLPTTALDNWRLSASPVQASCAVSYLMDSSSPATDLSGNGRSGTITGTTFTAGGPVVGGGSVPVTVAVVATSTVGVVVRRRRRVAAGVAAVSTATVSSTRRRRRVAAGVTAASTVTVTGARKRRRVTVGVTAVSTATVSSTRRRRRPPVAVAASSTVTAAPLRRRRVQLGVAAAANASVWARERPDVWEPFAYTDGRVDLVSGGMWAPAIWAPATSTPVVASEHLAENAGAGSWSDTVTTAAYLAGRLEARVLSSNLGYAELGLYTDTTANQPDGYTFEHRPDGTVRLWAITNGSYTTPLAEDVLSSPIGAGDRWTIERTGTAVRAYVRRGNGAEQLVLSATDSTFTGPFYLGTGFNAGSGAIVDDVTMTEAAPAVFPTVTITSTVSVAVIRRRRVQAGVAAVSSVAVTTSRRRRVAVAVLAASSVAAAPRRRRRVQVGVAGSSAVSALARRQPKQVTVGVAAASSVAVSCRRRRRVTPAVLAASSVTVTGARPRRQVSVAVFAASSVSILAGTGVVVLPTIAVGSYP